MENKTSILITGAGGFLGTWIVRKLLEKNFKVTNLSRKSYGHLDEIGVQTIKCDLSDQKKLESLDLSTFSAVIHTAALAGVWGKAQDYYNVNFQGTLNLLEKVKQSNIKYFVYTSSPSVVFGKTDLRGADESQPYANKYFTDYAKSKAMAEKEVLKSQGASFKTISLRPHLIWGPGDPHLIPRILEKAKRGRLRIVGDGENLVDIIYVENAAMAHVDALTSLMEGKEISGRAYFIGQESPVRLWEFINSILELNQIPPLKKRITFKKAFFLGHILEIIYKLLKITHSDPPMTRFIALQLAKSHYFSHDNAKKDFNYSAVISTKKGLERTFSGCS